MEYGRRLGPSVRVISLCTEVATASGTSSIPRLPAALAVYKLRPMNKIRGSRGIRFVSVLCALALILVSFVHRPVLADPVDSELAAYLAAGGSLSDICGSPTGEASGVECPACIIAKILAQAPEAPGIVTQAEWKAVNPPSPTTCRVRVETARTPPVRGPPLIQTA